MFAYVASNGQIMWKYLLLLSLVLIKSLCFAQSETGEGHIWEKAAFGEKPAFTYINIQGINPAITTTYEVMWGESANYVPKTTAISSPICESSSANDAAAGTGARTISVTGVNTSFARFTETVTLNGQTSVAMATSNILFIDKITVATAGSGLVNAGIVQCGDTDAGAGDLTNPAQYLPVSSVTAIPAAGAGGGNVSQSFMYAVPSGYTLICRNLTMSTYLATTVIGIQAIVDGYTNSTGVFKRYASLSGNNAGGNGVTDPKLMIFPEKTLIVGKMAGTAAAVGMLSMECVQILNSWEDTGQGLF